MNKPTKEELRNRLESSAGEKKNLEFEMKFKDGYTKMFKPGQKYQETNDLSEICQTLRNLHDDEWAIFKKAFGYSLQEIEAIGVEKFVKALGWTNRFQVASWKSDKMHFLICPNCKDDFGIWEMHSGLCNTCKPLFFTDLISAADCQVPINVEDAEKPMSSKFLFLIDPLVREMFKKKDTDILKAIDMAKDDSDFVDLLITNAIIGDLVLVAIGANDSVDEGISALEHFPESRMYKVAEETMISDRVKLSNFPELEPQLGFFKEYMKKYIRDIEGLEETLYDIQAAAIDVVIDIATLQEELIKG